MRKHAAAQVSTPCMDQGLGNCMLAQKSRHQHSGDQSSGSYLLTSSALQMSCDDLVRDTPCITKAHKIAAMARKTENT
jgi:hypothetical protein